MEFLNKQTNIAEIEKETADNIKMRDADGVLFTLWKADREGNIKQGYDLWEKLPDKFMSVDISYYETPYEFTGKDGQPVSGTHKNITGFKWTAEGKPGHLKKHPQPEVMEQKVSNDSQMREAIKPKDDIQQHIKYGLAWNVASRLIAGAYPDGLPYDRDNLLNQTDELAKEIYKRVQELPTDNWQAELNEDLKEQDDSALDNLINEFGGKQDNTPTEEIPF